MAPEVTTVADDGAVIFDGPVVHRYDDLEPDRDYSFDGCELRTLPRPPGERLCVVTTANDVHFGETECGELEGIAPGPVFRAPEGAEPYPELMNQAAVAEMAAVDPAAVVVKGDLTTDGTVDQYEQFLACYQTPFGDRLVHVRGNHDAHAGETFAAWPTQLVEVPGLRLAVLDTTIPGWATGRVTVEQLAWLADVAADARQAALPMLVLGHHHPWSPDSATRQPGYFGLDPDSSDALVGVVAAHPAIVGYAAGHTHRNRVRRFAATGPVPWIEVACVKDFPGSWAEYRVHEGGILQIHHRIAAPAAVAWSELTRGMFGGLYPQYAFGTVADRCFPLPLRSG